MWRTIFAVTVAIFLHVGMASAAGPFDGEWTGKNLTSRYCRPTEMTLSIHDGEVKGQSVRPNGGTANFGGKVTADGALKDANGNLEGTFSADRADIVFHTKNEQCPDVRFSLTKAK